MAALSVDPELFLHGQLAQAIPDLMRELLSTFVNALLGAGRQYVWRRVRLTNTRAVAPP